MVSFPCLIKALIYLVIFAISTIIGAIYGGCLIGAIIVPIAYHSTPYYIVSGIQFVISIGLTIIIYRKFIRATINRIKYIDFVY